MEQQERSKMLGSMKMTSLVPKVSVPIMISMLVQALYNVVDSMFVAKYDPDALTAVSLAYPIQVLMIAVSTGLGVGINSLISRRLGEKRVEDARDAAKNGFFLLLLGYLLFLIFGLFFDGLFFRMSTKDETLRALGETYTGIVTIFSFGLFFSIGFERLVQATGNTMLSMIMQLVGAITNIILDPIMIFGYCGCPKMGIAGAAIATVAGQMFSMILGFILNQTKNPELKLCVPQVPSEGRNDEEYPDGRLPEHHHAVDFVGDEFAVQSDSDAVRQCGGERAGRVFQASVVRVHAGVRAEQWAGRDRRLQLRRAAEEARV